MSWLYRFFKKSDDEQTVTVTVPTFTVTGDLAVTGDQVFIGDTVYTGNFDITGVLDVDQIHTHTAATVETLAVPGTMRVGGVLTTVSNLTVSGTARPVTSPLYLGTGTLGIFFGSAAPWSAGIVGADMGSLYINNTTGTIFRKYGYASTEWATITATIVATW